MTLSIWRITKVFKLFITKGKVEKVKKVVGELLEKRGRKVAIKEIAFFLGLDDLSEVGWWE